jgi:hypothetical protein
MYLDVTFFHVVICPVKIAQTFFAMVSLHASTMFTCPPQPDPLKVRWGLFGVEKPSVRFLFPIHLSYPLSAFFLIKSTKVLHTNIPVKDPDFIGIVRQGS